MITSLRAAAARRSLALRWGAPLGLCMALAACAAPAARPVVSSDAAAEITGPTYATVALVRPVPAGTQGEGAVLAALGLPFGGGETRSEVLVRTDGGQTVSVVTAAAAGLVPGARVVVLPGSPLRLGRPGMTAPAS